MDITIERQLDNWESQFQSSVQVVDGLSFNACGDRWQRSQTPLHSQNDVQRNWSFLTCQAGTPEPKPRTAPASKHLPVPPTTARSPCACSCRRSAAKKEVGYKWSRRAAAESSQPSHTRRNKPNMKGLGLPISMLPISMCPLQLKYAAQGDLRNGPHLSPVGLLS